MATATSTSSDAVTAPPPAAAAHPPKPLPSAPLPPPPPSDPVTASHPIKTHPHPHPPPLLPLLARAPSPPPPFPLSRSPFPLAAAVRPGYVRSAGAQSVAAAFPAASAQQPHPRPPFVFTEQLPRPPPAPPHQTAATTQQAAAGSHFPPPRQVRPAIPPVAAGAPPRGSALQTGPPKVAPFSTISSTPDYNSCKEREKSREDAVVTIHDRKVRLSDGGSGSLYALCRSWVRNGLPQENQPTIGDGVRLLPRPFPVSYVEARTTIKSEDDVEAENHGNEEHVGSGEDLSTRELLAGHIKRAKRVRAQLRKKRLLRIERYKQRLALLLPPPSELGRPDAAPGG